ncbi:MAG: UDP-N-acetylglucosamine 1-carboxyvinyltransferase [Bacteroidetes bacterium]|nr:UDP-N-acetylglucosamine 1-carboxyvinyltransferase [Bacteroidota bacterium]MCH8523724.1 UDP-N-acetylglucosamine 1-carboxyvinyltransferase [Balneolales bacterium]
MDKFIIEGNTPLKGNITVSGSKNAALPLMAAALLGNTPSVLENIPRLNDIYTFNNVLRVTGTVVDFNEGGNQLTINPSNLSFPESPYDLVRKMRASFYMLGALLAHSGYAKVSLPGGCAWGPRPVNLHLEGLKALGAEITMDKGYVIAKAPNGRLPGGNFKLEPSSVGATVNILLAAVKAQGVSVIRNAAREPDVVLLCQALNSMGARIKGLGTSELTIEGVSELQGTTFRNAPDRIEAGTFMIAAAMHPESDLTIDNIDPSDLGHFRQTFDQIGVTTTYSDNAVRVQPPEKLNAVSIKAEIYPGFPTDLQAQWATMLTQAHGEATVTDHIYYDRFSYVPELGRLGANAVLHENTVTIKGKTPLQGASVMSTDLRASVSLVMAGMVAEGTTEVLRVYHLDRGYENLEKKLNAAGALISRVSE